MGERIVRHVAFTVAALYVVIGLLWGLTFKYAVPPTNALGVAYITLTWPAWVKGSPLPTPPDCRACFTFKEPPHD